ncbi:hypothetical protein D3C75_346220 [compost metagenome]
MRQLNKGAFSYTKLMKGIIRYAIQLETAAKHSITRPIITVNRRRCWYRDAWRPVPVTNLSGAQGT